MRVQILLAIRVAFAAFAANPVFADESSSGLATIYGLELEVSRDAERLVVLADEAIEATIIELNADSLMLGIPGAVLDSSAKHRLQPVAGNVIERVSAIERKSGRQREVRIVIDRARGPAPIVSAPGRLLTIEFPNPDSRSGRVRLDQLEEPLEQVVRRVAKATGETYVFDESLASSVTIIAPDPISGSEAVALLDSVLLLRGFAAVPMPGRGKKILPIANAPAPWQPDLRAGSGDEPITTLLRLRTANAATVLAALRPLLGAYTLGFEHAPSNALILSGSARRIERLRRAIEVIDAAEAERVLIWSIRHALATDVADQLAEAFDERALPEVEADERTNSVILRASAQEVDRLRDFVSRVDRPAIGSGAIHVLPVKYVNSDQIAIILNTLGTGSQEPTIAGAASLAGRVYTVAVDAHTRSLVVRADPETATLIAELVAEIDRIPAQVRIDVTVAEVSTSNSQALGFDYLLPLTAPESAKDLIAAVAGNPSGANPSTDGLVAGYTRSPLLIPIVDAMGNPDTLLIPRERFVLTAAARDILIRDLMNLGITVASGDEHEIFVGDNIPVPVARAEPGNALQVSQNIERADVGIMLRVRPTVGKEGPVQLEVEIDVSAVRESAAGDADVVGPTFSERTISTKISLEDGDVAVIGYASLPRKIETVVGVPFLQSIPILGFLFRSTKVSNLDTTLLIAVQASVFREETRAMAALLRREFEALERESTTVDSGVRQEKPF